MAAQYEDDVMSADETEEDLTEDEVVDADSDDDDDDDDTAEPAI